MKVAASKLARVLHRVNLPICLTVATLHATTTRTTTTTKTTEAKASAATIAVTTTTLPLAARQMSSCWVLI